MSRKLCFITALLLILQNSLVFAQTYPELEGDSSSNITPVRLTVESLFLERSQNSSQNLVLDEDNNLAPVLTGSDLGFGTSAGPRFNLGVGLSESMDIEGVYFGLHNWQATATAIGNNNRSIPGDLGLATFDYFAADAIQANYGSEIHNAELNSWLKFQNIDLLFGFRYVSVTDDFQLASFDADTFQSDYRINTDNQMYGGQIGARLKYDANYFALRPEVKFAVLGNSQDQATVVRDLNNTLLLRDVSLSGSGVSTLSELKLVGDAKLTENLLFTAGYNLFWVSNVAQAMGQLDFTDTNTSSQFLNDSHSVFLHGASVGFVIVR